MRKSCVPAVLLAMSLIALPAGATVFCGGNGVVKLSFSAGPELQPVLEAAADSTGRTVVRVWAVLDEVDTVEGPGGVFLALGGYELELRVTGADAAVLEKAYEFPYRDFGKRPTQCWVGTAPGETFVDGRLALCSWTVAFDGSPADVRFDLDPAGLLSCESAEGCPDSGASALYVGTIDSHQEGHLFAAGCAPAVLNPTGTPDLEPAPCEVGYADVGIFAKRRTDR